jgi:hypothetical protein
VSFSTLFLFVENCESTLVVGTFELKADLLRKVHESQLVWRGGIVGILFGIDDDCVADTQE